MIDRAQNHGFIADEITYDDYMLGGPLSIDTFLGSEVLQPSGQWDAFLPQDELQYRNNLETMNCTAYGSLNCLEILLRRKFGQTHNYSDRYLGIMSDTTQGGNSPHKVLEVMRKKAGAIEEEELPFGEDIQSWSEYYSPKPMYPAFLKKGFDWLDLYTFKHEWVFRTGTSLTEKQKRLIEALKYSPVGVSVVAWQKRGEKYYKTFRQPDTHWCTLYGYVEGNHWKIFDHYDETHKMLEWNYDFGYAKRFHIEKNTTPPGLMKRLARFFNKYLAV